MTTTDSREIERHTALRSGAFVGFERAGFLLRDPDDDDPVLLRRPGPMAGDDRILILTRFELDQRHGVVGGERLHAFDKAIVHRPKQRRRRNGMSEMVAQKVAESAGRLELGHVALHMEAIEAADTQGHVIRDNGLDVGRHQILLGRKIDDGTRQEHTDDGIGPNIISEASPQTRRLAYSAFTRRFEAKLH